MKPFYEAMQISSELFPIRAYLRSSKETGHVYAYPHWHEAVEILYFICGKALQQVGTQKFSVSDGDLVIINSCEVHSTYTDKDNISEILVLQFGRELAQTDNISAREKDSLNSFFSGLHFPNPLKVDNPHSIKIIELISDIYNELDGKLSAHEIIVRARVYELIAILEREYGGKSGKNDEYVKIKKAQQLLEKSFNYIRKNYSRKITLQEVADISNISVSHFCRLFKIITGMTFIDYLNLYRISKAEELLLTEKTIIEIAYECGFNSAASFTRSFKSIKDCSPSQYRKTL